MAVSRRGKTIIIGAVAVLCLALGGGAYWLWKDQRDPSGCVHLGSTKPNTLPADFVEAILQDDQDTVAKLAYDSKNLATGIPALKEALAGHSDLEYVERADLADIGYPLVVVRDTKTKAIVLTIKLEAPFFVPMNPQHANACTADWQVDVAETLRLTKFHLEKGTK